MKLLDKVNISFKKPQSKAFKLEIPSSDFIPYAFHLDENTIVTKNGHLLQTVKISGYSNLSIDNDFVDIRKKIRDIIRNKINNNKISFWFHTIRTKKDIDPATEFDSDIAEAIHDKWSKKNFLKEKYINEIYISLIYEAMEFSNNGQFDFSSYFSFDYIKNKQLKFFQEAQAKLSNILDEFINDLSEFEARKLKITISGNQEPNSELLEFFNKIINLQQENIQLPIVDLSEYLINHKVAFGNNTFEIAGKTSKYFGAIITLKEYHEISTKFIDTILTLPEQIVVTQTFSSANKELVHKTYQYQSYITEVSLDADLKKMSGLNNMFKNSNEFGESQLSIMVSSENMNKLNSQIKKCTDSLEDLGFCVYREDLNLEDIFWSQLPANFNFIKRKSFVDIEECAGFLSFNNYPAGSNINPWGNNITVFRTTIGTPYLFNFHNKNNQGNTIICGPDASFRRQIANFLISETSRYENVTTVYLSDKEETSKFIKLLQGKLYNTSDDLLVKFIDDVLSYTNISALNNLALEDLLNKIIEKIKNHENHFLIVLESEKILPNNIKNILTNISTHKNSILLLNTSTTTLEQSAEKILNNFATQILTPDKSIDAQKAKLMDISILLAECIKNLDVLQRQFLINQSDRSIIVELNISGMTNLIDILACNYSENIQKSIDDFYNNQDDKHTEAVIKLI